MFKIPDPILWIVLCLAVAVFAVDTALIVYIFYRRLSRNRYFQEKDATRRRHAAVLRSFLDLDTSLDLAVSALRGASSKPERDALQEVLLDGITPANRSMVTEVLLRLGFIEQWAVQAFGWRRGRQLVAHLVEGAPLPVAPRKKFRRIRSMRLFCVRRARAVAQLGQLDGEFAHVFMEEARHDPSPYVGRAHVAAMGQNREPYAVTLLLDLLRLAVESKNGLPVLSIKAALVRYSLTELAQFAGFLGDPNPRFRFLVVDTIREICDNSRLALSIQDFPESITRWFLEQAKEDSSADVRARSASVVGHFHYPGAVAALRALIHDSNEFVRLHAVRACADPYYAALIPDVVRKLADTKWRVREASVKTLTAFGQEGRTQLAEYFLATTDQYASEQIADEMQRGGIISEMLPALGSDGSESCLMRQVCSKMVRLGKTSLLTEFLGREFRPGRLAEASPEVQETVQKAKVQLLDVLAMSPTPQLMATMRSLARRKRDDLQSKARNILQAGVAPGKTASAVGRA